MRAWLLGALGVLLFALTIPMTRLANGSQDAPQLPPSFVAIGRAAAAGLLAACWLRAVAAPWPRRAQWPLLAAVAGGVVFGFPLCMGLAVRQVDAAHAAVVSGLLPLATAAVGAFTLRQRPSLGFWACALLGSVLVAGFAWWRGGASLQLADALLALAVLAGAVGYVAGARLSTAATPGQAAMPPAQAISWALAASLPMTLPLALWFRPVASASGAAWGAFAYLSVVSMWLGFFAWYRALALGGVLRISQVQLLQPFLAMLLAVPLLGERLDAVTVVVALGVLATVFVSRRMPVQRSR